VTIRSFLICCFSAMLVMAAVIFAVLLHQQRNAARLRTVQASAAEMVAAALHCSFLLSESNRAPLRAARQWSSLQGNLAASLARFEASGPKDQVAQLRGEFEAADSLFQEYLTARGADAPAVAPVRLQWLRQAVRGRLANAAAEAESALNIANERAKRSQAFLSVLLISTAAALPALLLAMMLMVHHRILPALYDLGEASEEIRAGRYGQPIQRRRRDEIGRLADTMERMRLSLLSTRAELDASNRRLEHKNILLNAKNEEIETFVYAVSHDLRGPLVNLVGFTNELELGLDRLDGSQPDVQPIQSAADRAAVADMRQSIGFVTDNAQRLEGLIDALLRLSRTGRQELSPSRCDMASIVRGVVDGYREQLSELGGEVVIGELPPARADQLAATRVIENLVSNAIKYRSRERPLRLEVSGERDGQRNSYCFTDNGLGFPHSAMERLFTAFQRYHPDHADGEGMGLIIVKRLIERSGGEIRVVGDVSEGSRICFTLPAAVGEVLTV
jgi:signal transduction histidine kinase